VVSVESNVKVTWEGLLGKRRKFKRGRVEVSMNEEGKNEWEVCMRERERETERKRKREVRLRI